MSNKKKIAARLKEERRLTRLSQAKVANPTVRFIKINMEGMYVSQSNEKFPAVLLSSFCPLARRFYTYVQGLVPNSFYAMQCFYRRAYSIWLGLINLGHYITKAIGLRFERLNCFIGWNILFNAKEKRLFYY